MVIAHRTSQSNVNSILKFIGFLSVSPSLKCFIPVCCEGGDFSTFRTKRSDSFLIFTKLFNVLVGSFA